MLHVYANRRQRAIILMIALFAILGIYAQTVSAAYRGCRADPIVWLSNGAKIQMMVQAQSDASSIDRIVYTVHAPVGTAVERTVYTGGALADKEEVVFVADMPSGQYTIDTLVISAETGIDVIASTRMKEQVVSVTGLSNEHLVVHINHHQ